MGKKLLLTLEEREAVKHDTFLGAHVKLKLSLLKAKRETYRSGGFIAMKRAERVLIRITNMVLLDRDTPKKWWQLF